MGAPTTVPAVTGTQRIAAAVALPPTWARVAARRRGSIRESGSTMRIVVHAQVS